MHVPEERKWVGERAKVSWHQGWNMMPEVDWSGVPLLRLGVLLACAGACNQAPAAGSGTLHPNEEGMMPAEQGVRVTWTSAASGAEVWQRARAIAAAVPSITLGGDTDEPGQWFGTVADGAVDREGRIFVLDRGQAVVRVFDRRGVYRFSVGGPGEGPEEFHFPTSLEVEGGTLFVGDATASIKMLALADSTASDVSQLRLNVGISDFCLLDELIVVLTQGQPAVRVFDRDGRLLRSFGTFYRSDHPLVEMSISEGLLACDEERGLVYAALQLLPEVRAYDPRTGEAQWSVRLEGLQMQATEETERGLRHGFVGGHERVQHLRGLYHLGDGFIAVVVAERVQDGSTDVPFHGLTLLVLDHSRPGRGAVVEEGVPLLHASAGRFLSHEAEPFPRVLLHEWVAIPGAPSGSGS